MEKDYFLMMEPELQEKLVMWMAKIQARIKSGQSQSNKGA